MLLTYISAVIQAIYSRSNAFDSNNYVILAVEDVVTNFKPPGLWLNIQVQQGF